MKLTTRTRYATRAMADLARQPRGKPVVLADIARRQDITVRYLGKIFRQLLRAKLIGSKKGPGGGYYLRRDPKSMRLSQIMEAVGESRAPVYCTARKRVRDCTRKSSCPTRPHWRKLHMLIDEFCSRLTLDSIMRNNAVTQ